MACSDTALLPTKSSPDWMSRSALLQLLAAAADENSQVGFESIEFTHSKEERFERQVRDLALEEVMEQKTFYESTLGVELRPVNFFHDSVQQLVRAVPGTTALREEALGVGSLTTPDAVAQAPMGLATSPGFDAVEYWTSLTVVFEIVGENQNQINCSHGTFAGITACNQLQRAGGCH